MLKRGSQSLGTYMAWVVACLAFEWFVTPDDEPAAAAGIPFVGLTVGTFVTACIWGRWSASLVVPTAGLLATVLFQVAASGTWWLRDSGERGMAVSIFAMVWLFLATVTSAGVLSRRFAGWFQRRTGRDMP